MGRYKGLASLFVGLRFSTVFPSILSSSGLILVMSRAALVCACLLWNQSVIAGYIRANSDPVYIQHIYANEWGSPFVTFSASINSACTGVYLYDITVSQPNLDLRKNKMAVLLSAKAMGKRVVLDYFYDSGIAGWSACYIQGIEIVD